MDADAAELTYAQLQRNLTTEQDVSILLENTGSWITALEQKIHWCKKPRQVLNQLFDDAVLNNKLCFVHVDFDDKKSNPQLTALCNAFNDLAGRTIAKAFWSGTDDKEKNKLTDTPNTYLPELFAQGVRIIIVSPIIVSGWRYKAEPHFHATYGIYTQETQSAPHIIQRTQRVTHVRNHYIYVTPSSSYTTYDSLMADLEEELEYSKLEHSLKSRRDMASAKELISLAKTKKQKMMDNVKLHTILYWEEFGGRHEFWEFDEEERPELEILGEVINDALDTERLRLAEKILQDEYQLQAFMQKFSEYDVATACWAEMQRPTTPQQILKLFKITEDCELTYETARCICELLVSTESDWMSWDFMGPKWQSLDIETLAQNNTFQSTTTYRQLGLILEDIQNQLGVPLTAWLDNGADTPLVIQANELDTTKYNTIVNRYYNLLKTNHPKIFGNGVKAMDKVIVNIFRKVLLCDVKVSKPANKEVAGLKRELVEHYQSQGYLPKGDTSKRPLQKRAEAHLADRMRRQFELDDKEQEYFDKTGKIIVINAPTYRTYTRVGLHKIMRLSQKQPTPVTGLE